MIKKVVLVLVSIDLKKENHSLYTPGVASILASLKGCESIEAVPLVNNLPNVNSKLVIHEIINIIKRHPTETVKIGFSVFAWNKKIVVEIVKNLRTLGYCNQTIFGGASVTSTKENLEQILPGADVYFRGYAEEILPELLRSNIGTKIVGVHWAGDKDDGKIARLKQTPISPLLSGIYDNTSMMHFWLLTAIGCLYSCAYCLYDFGTGKRRIINFDMNRIQQEIVCLADRKMESIKIVDAIFNDKGNRCVEILEMFLNSGFKGKISAECRFEFVTREFIAIILKLRNAGIEFIPEFGLQTAVLSESRIIQRGNQMKVITDKIQLLNENGIHYPVSLIYGLPEQTLESFKTTIRFCKKFRIKKIQAFPLALYHGTKIYECRKDWGLETRPNENGIKLVYKTSTISESEFLQMEKIARGYSLNTGK
jgi:radical SAM superfamily enzyme YgiQ (UPF0313 family)